MISEIGPDNICLPDHPPTQPDAMVENNNNTSLESYKYLIWVVLE